VIVDVWKARAIGPLDQLIYELLQAFACLLWIGNDQVTSCQGN
jgi:hypothetical protein